MVINPERRVPRIEISSAELGQTTYTFNHNARMPAVTVRAGDAVVPASGYDVAYEGNVDVGTATVVVTGQNNFSGTVTATFVIEPADLSIHTIVQGLTTCVFNGEPQTQDVVVDRGVWTLVEGTDTEISYGNNVNAGTANMIVNGIGNYTGSIIETFAIEPADLSSATVSAADQTYSGEALTPAVTVTQDGKVLSESTDYDVDHTFTITGVNNAGSLVDLFWTTLRNPQKVERDILLHDSVSIENVQGVDVVVIRVPRAERGEKPVRVKPKRERQFVAWVRRGTSDIRASRDDIRQMEYDNARRADRLALEDFTVDALNEQTIERYRRVFAGNKPSSPYNKDSRDDFLYHIGALTRGRDGSLCPTQAGLLAFGHEYEITNLRRNVSGRGYLAGCERGPWCHPARCAEAPRLAL